MQISQTPYERMNVFLTGMGTFSLSSSSYSFNQSEGRGCVTVIRRDGMDGETSLQWKVCNDCININLSYFQEKIIGKEQL